LDESKYGQRNNLDAEANMARLLAKWRSENRPVIHVQHMSKRADSPLRPGHPGNEIKDEVKPLDGEPLIRKQTNSAFVGTDLEQQLRQRDIDTVVVVGLTTPHCVSTTTRMASDLGFRTYIVSDATASHPAVGHDGRLYTASEIHDTSLTALQGEFATVVETDALLRTV
jgi:nicotinamidase-related amidase